MFAVYDCELKGLVCCLEFDKYYLGDKPICFESENLASSFAILLAELSNQNLENFRVLFLPNSNS